METTTLEQIIRNHVQLPSHPSSKGWYNVQCKVCMDHGKKGDRGAFKFENSTVGYNCFNCDHGATFNHEDPYISNDMKTVLRDFGVPDEEWQHLLLQGLAHRDANGLTSHDIERLKLKSIEPLEIPYPESFYFLSNADENDSWAIIARDYLSQTLII